MDDHLPKPIHPAELDRLLLRWLGTQERRGTGVFRAAGSRGGVPLAERWERLRGELGGEVLPAALAAFRADAPGLLERLGAALAAGDRERAAAAAHALKGDAGNLACDELAAAARALEQDARAGTTGLTARLARVREEWAAVEAALAAQ
jgi:HPt (histidine-containing phosphotransfer) domain-containing protein